MKKIAFLFLTILYSALGAWAQVSNVTGFVHGEQKTALIGAVVSIESLQRNAIVDNNGRYNLTNVAHGTYKITVTYIGYKDITRQITVDGGTKTVDFDMTPSTVLIGGVMVTGMMGNQLRALNQQKTSDRIVNVISSEQIGSFPDMNVGDALKRVPGVYVSYNEGEADMVNIRGTGPNFSNFTINGASIPSSHLLGDIANDPTEPWTATGRGFSIQGIPADMVQSIEVNKTITPDMDGDAIGGSVNLVTRKAPYERRLSATLTGGYNSLVKGPSYNGRLFYGDRFFKKKFGVVFSASIYDQHLGSNSHQTEQWNMEKIGVMEGGSVKVNDYFLPNDFEIKQTLMERLRQSYTMGLDYQINPRHNISFTGVYNDYKDWRSQYTFKVDDLSGRALWKKAAGIPTAKDYYDDLGDANDAFDAWNEWAEEADANNDGVIDATGALMYDFDPTHPTFYPELERHAFAGSNSKKGGGLTQSRIINGALAGDHQFGALKIKWNTAYVKTLENKPGIREFEMQTNGVEDAPNGEEGARQVVMDYSNPRYINFNRGVDIGDVAAAIAGKPNDDLYDDAYLVNGWYLDNFIGLDVLSNSDQWTSSIDFELPIAKGKFANKLKFGGKMRLMTKENRNAGEVAWVPAYDPAFGDDDIPNWNRFWGNFGQNMQNVSSKFTNSRYTVGQMPTAKWIANQNVEYSGEGATTADWVIDGVEDPSLANRYVGKEKVYAGYLMTTQNFGPKLSMIAGVRLEHTILEFEGVETKAPMPVQEMHEKVEYDSWLPSMHFKFAPTDRVVLRAAYSKTISRQSFNDIRPSVNINITSIPPTYRLGNPDIKPWFSHNFDLLGEYYPKSIGLISAGIYYKKIQGFTYSREFQTPWSEIKPLLLAPDDPQLQQLVDAGRINQRNKDNYVDAYNRIDGDAGAQMIDSYQPANSDANASITGIELAYQRRLDFLPGGLRNLSLYANYTHNWMSKPAEDEKGIQVRLPGTASDALNFSLAYETQRVSTRLSYNYTSSFLSNPGSNGDVYRNRYCDAVNYLDFNIDYHIKPKKIILTGSVNNILNEATRYYYWQKQYTASNVVNGTRFQLGLIFNFF